MSERKTKKTKVMGAAPSLEIRYVCDFEKARCGPEVNLTVSGFPPKLSLLDLPTEIRHVI